MPMRFQKLASVIVLLFLAACAGSGLTSAPDTKRDCPTAGLVTGADRLPVFTTDNQKGAGADIKVLARMDNFRGACKYVNNKPEFLLELDFSALRTDKAGNLKSLKLPYFVAVLDKDENVLQKRGFWTKIAFDNNVGVSLQRHVIPVEIPTGGSANDIQIAFGFELTGGQYAYNKGLVK